jgi:hypothetical protein
LLPVDFSSQIIDHISSSKDQTADVITQLKDQTIYSTVLSMSQSKVDTNLHDNGNLHPPDNADATIIPHVNLASLLPSCGMRLWQAGGYKTIETMKNVSTARWWRTDTSKKSYWPMLQGPIFMHRLPTDHF